MRILFTILFFMIGATCMAQNATDFFNSAGNQYIEGDTQTALNTVNRGLERYPNDEKLQKLKEKLTQEKQKQEQEQQEQQQNQEQQDQQDQNQENQEQKDQEQQNQEQQEQQQNQEQQEQQQKQQQEEGEEGEEQEQQEQQEGEESEEDQKKKEEEAMKRFMEKLAEMKISREKAEMILEAMRNNEFQYIQDRKRKATKRKDRTKPDW